jgi:hypothetical protein
MSNRPPTMSSQQNSHKYTPEEWEAQKGNVERLYLSEERMVDDVIVELKRQYGFVAT